MRINTLILMLVGVSYFPLSTAQVVVDMGNANWGFLQESGTPGDATQAYLGSGPGSPPNGVGSIEISLANAAAGGIFGTQQFCGTLLADFTTLSYDTYQVAGPQALSLQLNIDYDLTDMDESWQGRLVYEPANNGTVQDNTWQTWDTLSGSWWATGTPGSNSCPQASPCTWSNLLAQYPNAGIHSNGSGLCGLGLKAGSGWPSGSWNADTLTVDEGSGSITFDFVPVELQHFSIE